MKLLALDLATRTGWALGEITANAPTSGSLRFAPKGAEHEELFGRALRWVTEMVKLNAPDLIAWEAPLPTSFKGGGTNANTTTILYGLPAVISSAAFLLKIPPRKVRVADVRRHFIGSNPKRAIAKKLTMARCQELGWDVSDDNEADALALWDYIRAQTIGVK